jgi:shikimate kinase
MNIVLIGFMGCGKTSVAKAIAKKTGRKAVELDAEIEKKAEKSIPEIFESEGEAGFRERESAACKTFAPMDGSVISCGGGIVLRPANVARLKKKGKIFWLEASSGELWKRLRADATQRPLLAGGSRGKFEELLSSRRPAYERAADVMVAIDGKSVEEIADEIIASA